MTNSQSPDRAALADELHALFEAYIYAPATDKLARMKLESALWDNKPGIVAHLRSPSPYSGAAGEAQRIEVDIGAAAAALEASPELCAMMNEMIGGPALVEAQAEIERLNAVIAALPTTLPRDAERETIERWHRRFIPEGDRS